VTYPPHTRTLFRGPEHWRAHQCYADLLPNLPLPTAYGEEQEYLRVFRDGDDWVVQGCNLSALEELQ
jgi:hypothetical protein